MAISDAPAAEVPIDDALVRSLLREQHPDLASLPLAAASEGWDNRLFRLGHDLVARLPRRQVAAELIEHEWRWLRELAPRLPLPVPAPLRLGRPGLGYPWHWLIAPWLAGETAATCPFHDERSAAAVLGQFLAALHQPAPDDAPVNLYRSSLAPRTERFHEALSALDGQIDAGMAADAWEAALAAPAWTGVPVWLHGDLHPENVLVSDGRVSAVIDFGDITAGDPAVDLASAWMLFTPAARGLFRQAAGAVDDGTWARARGWALTLAVVYLASSRDSPLAARVGRTTIEAVLADRAPGRGAHRPHSPR